MAQTKLIWKSTDEGVQEGVLRAGESFTNYTSVFMNNDLDTLYPVSFLRRHSKWIYIESDTTYSIPPDASGTITEIWGFKSEPNVIATRIQAVFNVFRWVSGTGTLAPPNKPVSTTYNTAWSEFAPPTPSLSDGQNAVLYSSQVTLNSDGTFNSSTDVVEQATATANTYYLWVIGTGDETSPPAPANQQTLSSWSTTQPSPPAITGGQRRILFSSTITTIGSSFARSTQPTAVSNTDVYALNYFRRVNGTGYNTTPATPTSTTGWSQTTPAHTFVATAIGQGTALYRSVIIFNSSTDAFISATAPTQVTTSAAGVHWQWTTGLSNPVTAPQKPTAGVGSWIGPFQSTSVANAPTDPNLSVGQTAQLWRGLWIEENGVVTSNASSVVSSGNLFSASRYYQWITSIPPVPEPPTPTSATLSQWNSTIPPDPSLSAGQSAILYRSLVTFNGTAFSSATFPVSLRAIDA